MKLKPEQFGSLGTENSTMRFDYRGVAVAGECNKSVERATSIGKLYRKLARGNFDLAYNDYPNGHTVTIDFYVEKLK